MSKFKWHQGSLLVFVIAGLLSALMMTACAFSANSAPENAVQQGLVVHDSQSQSVQIEAMAGVTAEETEEIRQAVAATERFYAATGLRLNKKVTLVLVKDRPDYIATVIDRYKISEIEAQRAARGTDALASYKYSMVIINISGIPSVRQKNFLTGHELTHHYQYQIAGGKGGEVMWLLEGMAEMGGAQVVQQQGYMTVRQYKDNWLGGLQHMAEAKPELKELRTKADWSASMSKYGSNVTYKTSALAALILTERYGQAKLIDYFVRLGKNETPETAFQNAFGIKLNDFNAEMAQMLKLKEAS